MILCQELSQIARRADKVFLLQPSASMYPRFTELVTYCQLASCMPLPQRTASSKRLAACRVV